MRPRLILLLIVAVASQRAWCQNELSAAADTSLEIDNDYPAEAPEEPVEITQPAEISEPVETVEPVETAEPVESALPVETTVPVEPEDPVEITQLEEISEPVETAEPVSTSETVESALPIETTGPLQAEDPVESAQPVVTAEPVTVDPSETADPVETVEPAEGSGSGPHDRHESALDTPLVDDTEATTTVPAADEIVCPTDLCTCSSEQEGDSLKLTVDCSSKDLTELPSTIDKRVTTLLLQNNKLEELPKSVSEFQELEELNINDNSITGFAFGSVSELPKLRVLKAANNRLLEFPQELKNGMDLRSLQELDLGGNDMREKLSADYFEHLESISSLTIPVSTPELVAELCHRLGTTLQRVCTNNCDVDLEECATLEESSPDTFTAANADESIDQVESNEGDILPEISVRTAETGLSAVEVTQPDPDAINNEVNSQTNPELVVDSKEDESTAVRTEDISTADEFSLRNAVSNANDGMINPVSIRSGTVVLDTTAVTEETQTQRSDASEDEKTLHTAEDVAAGQTSAAESETTEGAKVGAASVKQGGGIDNSVIALIVAGMVIVVAGVTIKKNWNTIRNRFRSRPSPGAGAAGGTPNGTTPEEVPLQDKSMV